MSSGGDSSMDLFERLKRIYAKYAPEKAYKISAAMSKAEKDGTEQKLIAKLTATYGPEPSPEEELDLHALVWMEPLDASVSPQRSPQNRAISSSAGGGGSRTTPSRRTAGDTSPDRQSPSRGATSVLPMPEENSQQQQREKKEKKDHRPRSNSTTQLRSQGNASFVRNPSSRSQSPAACSLENTLTAPPGIDELPLFVRVKRMYAKYAPEKGYKVHGVVDKAVRTKQEAKLMRTLVETYGPEPTLDEELDLSKVKTMDFLDRVMRIYGKYQPSLAYKINAAVYKAEKTRTHDKLIKVLVDKYGPEPSEDEEIDMSKLVLDPPEEQEGGSTFTTVGGASPTGGGGSISTTAATASSGQHDEHRAAPGQQQEEQQQQQQQQRPRRNSMHVSTNNQAKMYQAEIANKDLEISDLKAENARLREELVDVRDELERIREDSTRVIRNLVSTSQSASPIASPKNQEPAAGHSEFE